ncbi:hypothetical protein TNCV_1111871 [Trichonephila clavipes]|uniref:Uncharacterized protein n=1 Tax=Trichonephila clavipes TaxID=2585209 RepID=A0A8X6RDW6_TRICX|nr:hypothetical protein TNCV_1111871 [Trichonephila clavipes]
MLSNTNGQTAINERTCREEFQCPQNGDFDVEDQYRICWSEETSKSPNDSITSGVPGERSVNESWLVEDVIFLTPFRCLDPLGNAHSFQRNKMNLTLAKASCLPLVRKAKSPDLSIIQCRSSRAHLFGFGALRSGHLRSMTFV